MSQPKGADARSDEQIAHERALGQVSDTLLCIEQAIDRAKRGLKAVAKNGGDKNVELALNATLTDLQRVRKRLMQDTYYAGDAVRLM
ncbi:MAG: hypothetical protein ACR2KJ_13370 [Jatrophihabitans sp.]